VREKLDALINVGFWIGEDLYEEALRLSGELER
jgi:predicted nucleic acid-binding protein